MDESLPKSMTDTIVEEVQPEKVILFGSHAKGIGQGDSGVDPLVIMPDAEETCMHRRRLAGRLYRRLDAFPVSKDILVYMQGEVRWRQNVPGHIVATSLSEGRYLYVRP